LKVHLLAPTIMRIAPADLPGRVRARFAGELRRAGGFAQLSMLGAQACLDAAGGPEAPLGILWASRLGALRAVRAALDDDSLRRGEPAMPFTFIAMQPHLAGALLAQRGYSVTRSAHLHLADEDWPLLLRAALGWLPECERVLVGWVEESEAQEVAHRSDWCLLQNGADGGSIRLEPVQEENAAIASTLEGWIERVAEWQSAALAAPLLLRGSEGTWRFSVRA
jgi:hypothetical protein